MPVMTVTAEAAPASVARQDVGERDQPVPQARASPLAMSTNPAR